MPEILYSQIKSYLTALKAESAGSPLPSVMLIFGDEMLYKSALQTLLDVMIPPEKQAFSYEPVDGIPENVYPMIEKINTYSFFSSQKVVGFLDTRIFYAKKTPQRSWIKQKKHTPKRISKQQAAVFSVCCR